MTMTINARRTTLLAFMKSRGWAPEGSPGPVGELWEHVDVDFKIPVPHDAVTDDADWKLIIDRLAAQSRSAPAEIASQLNHWTVDVTKLRAASDVLVGDSIPLRAGWQMITSSWQLLRSSATTASGPRAWINGKYARLADELASTARMGHSQRGSYVIPILMPLTIEPETPESMFTGAGADGSTEVVRMEPLERRVMRTFAEALTSVDTIIVQPEREPSNDAVAALVTAGVSKEFASALQAILNESSVAEFSASFTWAPSLAAPSSVPTGVTIPSAAAERIGRIATKLAQPTRTSRPEIITGPVIEVRHPPDNPFGSIVVQAARNGRIVRVRVTVRQEGIPQAARWMGESETVIVQGKVTRNGNELRIEAPESMQSLRSTMLPGTIRHPDPDTERPRPR